MEAVQQIIPMRPGPGVLHIVQDRARQKAWLKDELRASRAPAKFLLSSVPVQGPWGADRWAG